MDAQYFIGGRHRRCTIGGHGSPWTVETARERAKVLLGKVAEGDDPREAKTARRASIGKKRGVSHVRGGKPSPAKR